MMRLEPHGEDLNVNIVLRSGITTDDNKGKQLEGVWVHKAPKKETGFDLEHAKETFIEVKKSFIEASTLGSQEKPIEEMDPSMITTFLETCMKLVHNRKVVNGL